MNLVGDPAEVQRGKGQIVVDPDWSLGTFVRTLVVRSGGDPQNLSAPILKVIDYYENGQRCDETGSGRKTEVHLVRYTTSIYIRYNSEY